MTTLNRISLFWLSAVLLLALTLTANASTIISTQAKTIVTSSK